MFRRISTIESLCEDVVCEIFSFLEVKDQHYLSLASRHFYDSSEKRSELGCLKKIHKLTKKLRQKDSIDLIPKLRMRHFCQIEVGDTHFEGHGRTMSAIYRTNLSMFEMLISYKKSCEILGFDITKSRSNENCEVLKRHIGGEISFDDFYGNPELLIETFLKIVKLGNPSFSYEFQKYDFCDVVNVCSPINEDWKESGKDYKWYIGGYNLFEEY